MVIGPSEVSQMRNSSGNLTGFEIYFEMATAEMSKANLELNVCSRPQKFRTDRTARCLVRGSMTITSDNSILYKHGLYSFLLVVDARISERPEMW